MVQQSSSGTRLRRLFERPRTTLMPFGVLPIHAQMAQRAGFEAFEVSGGLTSFWVGGVGDVGMMTRTDVVNHVAGVVRSVDIPIFADAETGFGAPAHVWRATQDFVRVGAGGIHIEDQAEPKREGHSGVTLASDEEAVGRLRAAIDVRDELDPDFVIVGRTDAAGAQGGGLEEAIRRGQLYQKAGADVVFFAGFSAWSDIRTALAAIDGPAYAIPDFGQSGRHPSLDDLTKMGQAINVVPFVFPGVQEVWDLLLKIRDSNDLSAYDDYLEHIFSLKGTERFVGIGDQFISPDHQTLASMEGKYLPRQS